MIIETFKYYTTAIIGLIESEREINFDQTNFNGVRFEAVVGAYGRISIYYSISFGNTEFMKYFYGVTDPEKVTLQGIIDAVKDMADFLEENKYMDQFELQTLIQERYEDS